MWFQRLVEIEESEPEPLPIPRVAERAQAVQINAGVKKSQVPASTPADFQRVRLMRTLNAWEQREQRQEDLVRQEIENGLECVTCGVAVSPYWWRYSLAENGDPERTDIAEKIRFIIIPSSLRK